MSEVSGFAPFLSEHTRFSQGSADLSQVKLKDIFLHLEEIMKYATNIFIFKTQGCHYSCENEPPFDFLSLVAASPHPNCRSKLSTNSYL